MSTSYKKVFKSFKKKIEDKDLPLFSEEEQLESMIEWLDTAIGYIELNQLNIINNLSDRDNESKMFNCDLLNCEIEVIAMYMVVAWYEPRINSLEHTLMFVGSSSEKWTSQKEHLNMMIDARERWKLEARKYFRNYSSRNNTYIKGDDS